MLKKKLIFDHIGIFVKSIKKYEKYINLLGINKKKSRLILDKSLGIKAKLYFDKKKICYELIEPYGKKNPIDGCLKRQTNILNHIAYKTIKFNDTINYLKKNNFMQITEIKYSKLFKSKIVFFLSPLKYVIEIIEKK